MTEHSLKTWPNFWDAVERGDKTFELRKNDRGFQRGDVLLLRKWDPSDSGFYVDDDGDSTYAEEYAATIRATVTYVLNGFGLEHGYVAIGFNSRKECEL